MISRNKTSTRSNLSQQPETQRVKYKFTFHVKRVRYERITTELVVLRSLIDTKKTQLFTILVLSHDRNSFLMLENSQHFKATSVSFVI